MCFLGSTLCCHSDCSESPFIYLLIGSGEVQGDTARTSPLLSFNPRLARGVCWGGVGWGCPTQCSQGHVGVGPCSMMGSALRTVQQLPGCQGIVFHGSEVSQEGEPRLAQEPLLAPSQSQLTPG